MGGAALTADSLFSDHVSDDIEVDDRPRDSLSLPETQDKSSNSQSVKENQHEEARKLPRWIYLSIMFCMVIISLIVISANADRTYVILVAQVFNGCLLPFLSTCLLLCLNDQQFMKASPQPLWANIFLVTSVLITMLLANDALLQKIFGEILQDISIRLGVAAGSAFAEMLFVSVITSLGRDFIRSINESKLSLLCFVETNNNNNNTEEERNNNQE